MTKSENENKILMSILISSGPKAISWFSQVCGRGLDTAGVLCAGLQRACEFRLWLPLGAVGGVILLSHPCNLWMWQDDWKWK